MTSNSWVLELYGMGYHKGFSASWTLQCFIWRRSNPGQDGLGFIPLSPQLPTPKFWNYRHVSPYADEEFKLWAGNVVYLLECLPSMHENQPQINQAWWHKPLFPTLRRWVTGLWEVQGHLWLQSEFETSLGYLRSFGVTGVHPVSVPHKMAVTELELGFIASNPTEIDSWSFLPLASN